MFNMLLIIFFSSIFIQFLSFYIVKRRGQCISRGSI